MRVNNLLSRVCNVLFGFVLSLGAVSASAHHEVDEAKKLIEHSLKKTFEAFNKNDYVEFVDGFTDLACVDKSFKPVRLPDDVVRLLREELRLLAAEGLRAAGADMVIALASVTRGEGDALGTLNVASRDECAPAA